MEREGIEGLISGVERWRGGNPPIGQHDFEGSTTGSRFSPLLYTLSRVRGARDSVGSQFLSAGAVESSSSLAVHYTFPENQLCAPGFERADVNAIASICFLTTTAPR